MSSSTATTNAKLRIGYVPEHFSSPLLQLAKQDPSIELVSCPSGTGQIMLALKEDKIDIAIALTEALIAGSVQKKAEYKIVGTYVTSPLNWAVAVGKESKYQSLADLRGEKIGISRIGSGSQVMASYMALQQGWVDKDGKVEPIQFEVLDTFKMWEHFTTKPYLSELRFIDHVLTPWSSWLIVASPTTTTTHSQRLVQFLDELSESIAKFDHPEARQNESKDFVKTQFGYPENDVVDWLKTVKYPELEKGGVRKVEKRTMEMTLKTLEQAGVLETPQEGQGWDLHNFVDTNIADLI